MSGHTPGPWRVYKGWVHPSFDGPSPQTTNADTAICEPLGPDAAFNARLIAAAPDLLEALEGLLPWLEAAETKCLVGHEGCVWAVEQVRAAIANASQSGDAA